MIRVRKRKKKGSAVEVGCILNEGCWFHLDIISARLAYVIGVGNDF
jgi:hypothetical protein